MSLSLISSLLTLLGVLIAGVNVATLPKKYDPAEGAWAKEMPPLRRRVHLLAAAVLAIGGALAFWAYGAEHFW